MPGQELMQLGSRVIIDPAENIGEPGLRIDTVELGSGDQRVDRHGALAAAVGASEQPRAAPESNRPVILPISGRRSRSIIAGTHIMGDAFVANMSSGASAAMSFTSR